MNKKKKVKKPFMERDHNTKQTSGRIKSDVKSNASASAKVSAIKALLLENPLAPNNEKKKKKKKKKKKIAVKKAPWK